MSKRKFTINAAQWMVAGLLAALAMAMLYYRFLIDKELEQTAALYIGLPALIAIMITLTPKANSPVGMSIKAVLIAMFASAIFLREGFICILMCAPLFLAVAIAVGFVIGRVKKSGSPRDARLNAMMLLPILVMSVEGVLPGTGSAGPESVTVERVLDISGPAIQQRLSAEPEFDLDALPRFLQLGFPVPVEAQGTGLAVGDQRVITFAVPGRTPGTLVLEVTQSDAHGFVMQAVSDTSDIANWMAWKSVHVRWDRDDTGQTRLSWSVTYERLLAPAWYFGPLERLAVEQAIDYLIGSLVSG